MGNDKTSSVVMGSFPMSKVSQNASGTMDIIKKKTSVPATVVYFFNESKSYFSRKYRYAERNLYIVKVCPNLKLFKRKSGGFRHRFRFFIRLCHREWLILAEIFFSDLTRKIQERQVFCEGAYPQRSVTEQTHTVFHSIFPSKINQVM